MIQPIDSSVQRSILLKKIIKKFRKICFISHGKFVVFFLCSLFLYSLPWIRAFLFVYNMYDGICCCIFKKMQVNFVFATWQIYVFFHTTMNIFFSAFFLPPQIMFSRTIPWQFFRRMFFLYYVKFILYSMATIFVLYCLFLCHKIILFLLMAKKKIKKIS